MPLSKATLGPITFQNGTSDLCVDVHGISRRRTAARDLFDMQKPRRWIYTNAGEVDACSTGKSIAERLEVAHTRIGAVRNLKRFATSNFVGECIHR